MVIGYIDELWEALAEPHGNVSFHVDSKRFKPLLQATDGEVAKTADVLSQVDPADLGQAQTTNRYEAWKSLKCECVSETCVYVLISIGVIVTVTFSYLNVLKRHLGP